MATIGNKFVDLIDLFKRQEDGMRIATVIELLKESNPILDDAMAVECNNGSKHRTTVRTGLPEITWGQLYKGVPQEKSETAQVEDTTGMAEALSTIDKRLLDLSGGNEAALRLSEARAFLEAMNQEVASTLFYGNVATDPEKFTGFTPRFNDLSAANGGQIVSAGGTAPTAQTSLWMVYWGDRANHLIYPKGTKAGVSREDKGEQRVADANGDAYYAKEEMFRWHVGLSVRDWRYVARVANIEIGTTTPELLLAAMRSAWWRIRSHRLAGGNGAIYCNSDVCELLDSAITPSTETNYTGAIRVRVDEADGKEVMTYRGVPVRQVDALVNTEAVVS